MTKPDRHGEWDSCQRCGIRGIIYRMSTTGLSLGKDGLIVCWNGRDCSLRAARRRRQGSR